MLLHEMGRNTKPNIAKMVSTANINFWFLRKMENGLAIACYPSIEGVQGGTRLDKPAPAGVMVSQVPCRDRASTSS